MPLNRTMGPFQQSGTTSVLPVLGLSIRVNTWAWAGGRRDSGGGDGDETGDEKPFDVYPLEEEQMCASGLAASH